MLNQMGRLLTCIVGMTCGVAVNSAYAQADLQIISPETGAVLSPGQSLIVKVTRSSSKITAVALVGDLLADSGGISAIETGQDPLSFTVTIPKDKRPGTYRLVAIDTTNSLINGSLDQSAPLIVVVDITTAVSSIIAPLSLSLGFEGDDETIMAAVTLADGTKQSIFNAPGVTYVSADTDIARVDSYGRVIGMAVGNTKIAVQYKGQQTSVNIVVPNSIAGDLNGDGKVDLDDLAILTTRLNTNSNCPNDARDLDHDGKIDALDARILTTLCTYPRCATAHP